ncbi:MAG: glycosyltransferase family 2 protein [Kiritimatiellaeota bacterium]|nr:glycosyltransferase family 2 protein [Kiritimatiellota bacterium]
MTPGSKTCCVIPVFNHSATLRSVVEKIACVLDDIAVVDDGSTDADIAETLAGLPVALLEHGKNLGKGAALRTGAKFAVERGCLNVITIDADGQHDPMDIPNFLALLSDSADTIIVGERDFSNAVVPFGSRFGRKFSDFWVRLETGLPIMDSQSGFRAYPAKFLAEFEALFKTYAFETEVLVRGAWSGYEIKSVGISVSYSPEGRARISHFNPWKDNLRLSLLHSRLVAERLASIFTRRK